MKNNAQGPLKVIDGGNRAQRKPNNIVKKLIVPVMASAIIITGLSFAHDRAKSRELYENANPTPIVEVQKASDFEVSLVKAIQESNKCGVGTWNFSVSQDPLNPGVTWTPAVSIEVPNPLRSHVDETRLIVTDITITSPNADAMTTGAPARPTRVNQLSPNQQKDIGPGESGMITVPGPEMKVNSIPYDKPVSVEVTIGYVLERTPYIPEYKDDGSFMVVPDSANRVYSAPQSVSLTLTAQVSEYGANSNNLMPYVLSRTPAEIAQSPTLLKILFGNEHDASMRNIVANRPIAFDAYLREDIFRQYSGGDSVPSITAAVYAVTEAIKSNDPTAALRAQDVYSEAVRALDQLTRGKN